MTDIIVRGGTVVDGSGEPRFRADVAVEGGRIRSVGRLEEAEARLVLDAGGLIVAPGFIDSHSHSELALLTDPLATPKVAQGVTTEIVGNCGLGPFFARSEEAREAMGALVPRVESAPEPASFDSLAGYAAALRQTGTAVNVAALVPHGPVRISVMGEADRPASQAEVRAMRELVRRGFEEGAVGLSLGLLYAPGCFTPREELSALGREAAAYRRPLVFHVRNECDRFEESAKEAIEIGRQAGAPVHISHLKVADPAHWGQVGRALRQIEEANGRGERVTCDQYPYTAGSGSFQTLLPPWSLAGGRARMLARLRDPGERARITAALEGREVIPGWDNISGRIGWDRVAVGSAPGAEEWEGRRAAELSTALRRPASDLLFDLLLRSKGSAIGIYHQMCEQDVREVLVHPAQMVGSDGLPAPGRSHPRLWGTFPRVLGHYCRELGLLRLEQAIHKMSGRTAQTFGLELRGQVRAGYHADLCIFDAERIRDRASYDEPTRPPEGIVHVMCNGVPVVLEGSRTDHRPGRFLAAADPEGGG